MTESEALEVKTDLLEAIAAHLERGQLGHAKFDFSCYNKTFPAESIDRAECGYAGCAIGELPIIFPEHWTFEPTEGKPVLRSQINPNLPLGAADYLGLTFSMFTHLFVPRYQKPERYYGMLLDNRASRYDVAANIREFLELVYSTLKKD